MNGFWILQAVLWMLSGMGLLSIPLNGFQRASANVIASLLGDLSIPLNGFLEEKEKELEKMEERTFNSIERILMPRELYEKRKATFNSIERIPSGALLPPRPAGAPFNSIERILHHHGLCCVWKFSISIHMDSIQLSPREGLHDYSVC